MIRDASGQTKIERHKIEILIRRDQISNRVAELGRRISADYATTTPVLIGALKGCFMFMADLARAISVPCEMEFISSISYRNGVIQDDTIAIGPSPLIPLRGRDVIFVEGVVDSGRTLLAIQKRLLIEAPRTFEVATLLMKRSAKLESAVKYVGFEIDDQFVIGYGMDYSQLYRNLDFIGHVREFTRD